MPAESNDALGANLRRLRTNGIKVLALKMRADGFFGLSVAEGVGAPAVVVNTLDRITVERWIFTAAHELGHLVLHRHDYDVAEADERDDHENEAHVFASHFLMPEATFRSEWQDASGLPIVERVLKVKGIFRVSWRTVLHRAAEHDGSEVWERFLHAFTKQRGKKLSRLDEPHALGARAFRGLAPEWRPAQEPESVSATAFVSDRLHLLVRQGIERKKISLSRGAEVLGLSLIEMRELAASWAR